MSNSPLTVGTAPETGLVTDLIRTGTHPRPG